MIQEVEIASALQCEADAAPGSADADAGIGIPRAGAIAKGAISRRQETTT
jgi:hypothetical protein